MQNYCTYQNGKFEIQYIALEHPYFCSIQVDPPGTSLIEHNFGWPTVLQKGKKEHFYFMLTFLCLLSWYICLALWSFCCKFPIRPWSTLGRLSISHLYSDIVASGSGTRNSHLVRISGGATPPIRFVSSFGCFPPVTAFGAWRTGPSIEEGMAPGTTVWMKGSALAVWMQNSIHWWISGDGPLTLPPIFFVFNLEAAGTAYKENTTEMEMSCDHHEFKEIYSASNLTRVYQWSEKRYSETFQSTYCNNDQILQRFRIQIESFTNKLAYFPSGI